ncbi:MAG: single-stranded-DNA-specific exonuclease RecJ [Aggregatilineales bacterium]
MSTSDRLWRLRRQPPSAKHVRAYKGMSPVLAQVLYNRGFDDPAAAARFLYAKGIDSNPFAMKGVSQAVTRIRRAVQAGQKIVVYGDFDADGVTSTVLMVQVLQTLGANVEPYIPHRVDEGYGLNSQALEKLAAGGAKVVVTVDCGIRSVKEVEDGKRFGLDMIVTDHHSVQREPAEGGMDIVPAALAVINPKQMGCEYGQKHGSMLAGVGVAYRLADALLRVASHDRKKPSIQLEALLDLVAIGTVADLAPLNEIENRALVRMGLAALNRAERPGIQALLEVSGVKPGQVTATTIGFALGPRINAAGRLDSAMLAYNLLAAPDYDTALPLARALQALNVERQELTRATQEAIRSQFELEKDAPLIFAQGEFQPGIVGLVAGRLVEEYYRPAVVMELGETESRASCRSIPQFDITAALDRCAELLVRHGGHAQAAGLTVYNDNIPELEKRLKAAAAVAFEGAPPQRTLEYDAEVDLATLNEALWEELQQLEPTGHGNEKPVLISRAVRLLDKRTVGADGTHLKLRLARLSQPPLDAIGFRLGEQAEALPDVVDIAYQLDMNEWNGCRSLQLVVQDIKPAGAG